MTVNFTGRSFLYGAQIRRLSFVCQKQPNCSDFNNIVSLYRNTFPSQLVTFEVRFDCPVGVE
jgi:hypothetical protein